MRHAKLEAGHDIHTGPGAGSWPRDHRLASTAAAKVRRVADGLHRLFDDLALGSAAWDAIPEVERATSEVEAINPIMEDIWDPDVAVYRQGDTVVVRADLKGLDRDHVHVNVGTDALTISGEWAVQQPAEASEHHRSERNHGTFYRAIPLAQGADAEHCSAQFKDGVLEVRFEVPHVVEPKVTSIPIE